MTVVLNSIEIAMNKKYALLYVQKTLIYQKNCIRGLGNGPIGQKIGINVIWGVKIIIGSNYLFVFIFSTFIGPANVKNVFLMGKNEDFALKSHFSTFWSQ